MNLAIVGGSGGTNIGASLQRASASLGHRVDFFDAAQAHASSRLLRAVGWRIAKRPWNLGAFSRGIVEACEARQPALLIGTGAAPVEAEALRALKAKGVVLANYSTDDPWSAGHRAAWHLAALPLYDIVFTPRRANMADFERLGCRRVVYLPFGYDDALFHPGGSELPAARPEVLFVGGADPQRVAFLEEFMREGPEVSLVGDYWHRYRATARLALGHKPPEELRALTAAARVNLCLVRHANRDGHVMRSLEIPAVGACMLAEDTAEHRELLGDDGEAVCYFRSAREASRRARELLGDPAEARRLAESAHWRIVRGAHTYRDRLAAMLAAAQLT